MNGLWALVSDAGQASAEERARLEAEAAAISAGRDDRVLLATCHRVELYGLGQREELAGMRVLRDEQAVRRLLRVAAGLESAVVGEDEVLRQVRDALAGAGPRVHPRLRRLFETAIAAGRAARSRRKQRPDGLAERAVAWLGLRVDLHGGRLLVAGAGRTGTALADAARAAGAEVLMASRNRATSLAEAALLAPEADAIAIALAGPWHELAEVTRPLPPVADLSAPPALPARARERAGQVLTIDDLYDRSGDENGYREAAEAVVDKHAAELGAR